MSGDRTTRAIKNSTARPNHKALGKLRLLRRASPPATREAQPPRHVPTPQTIRTNGRTPRVARARTTRGLLVAREVADLARARGKARAEITAGVGRGIVEGGAGGDHAISNKAAVIATARMMAATTRSN